MMANMILVENRIDQNELMITSPEKASKLEMEHSQRCD